MDNKNKGHQKTNSEYKYTPLLEGVKGRGLRRRVTSKNNEEGRKRRRRRRRRRRTGVLEYK
jgi:hypothetical protein